MEANAISLRGVVKRFGAITAVNGLDLDVPEGTCVGLLGPNGAGKSTTMKLLTAQAIADEGSIDVLGYTLPGDSKAARAEMGVVPQLDNLDTTLTVEQNLRVFTYLYRVPRAQRREAIERALEMANLSDRRDTRADKLSGGMRRRLLISRALVHRPRLVLLDEPTVGLDPQVRQELWALIDALRSEGTSILMSTHYIEEAERLADTVTIMSARRGRRHGAAVRADRAARRARGRRGLRAAGQAARGRDRRARGRDEHPPHGHLGGDPAPRRRDQRRRPGRRAPAREPRGRLRPADRRGDLLMATVTESLRGRRRLGRLERPALAGVLVREVINYSSYWRSVTFSSTVEPTIYLLAFGFGFGSLVSTVAGYDYVEFVGTGTVATAVLFSSVFAAMFGTFVKREFQRTYDAILAAPVDTEELVTAEALWIAIRASVYGCAPLLVAMIFGLDPAWGMLLVPGINFITGFGWASAGALISALMKSIDNFSYVTSTLITPMFLVAGTFFPISGLPEWAQIAAWFNPLYHCVELVRHAAFGFEGWVDVAHLGVLLFFGILMWRLAIWATGRRLID